MSAVPVLDAAQVHRAFAVFDRLVADHASLLDELNAFPVPDADTGRNLSATTRAALEAVGTAVGLPHLCAALADGAFMGARGNSGTILAQLLSGFFEVAGRCEVAIDGPTLASGLIRAAEVGPLCVAEVANGTMLTVAADVAAAIGEKCLSAPLPLVDILELAWSAGHVSLARTPELNPVLGRAGVVDAGAAGYLLLLDALLHVVDGRELPRPDDALLAPSKIAFLGQGETQGPAYEVMFALEESSAERAVVLAVLRREGESVVVTGRGRCWTCHVHTDDIGAVLESVLPHGRPRRIRVEVLHLS
jgi:dihydroxyacetone kinase-like predicted kinase